jgi:hypothetical protein
MEENSPINLYVISIQEFPAMLFRHIIITFKIFIKETKNQRTWQKEKMRIRGALHTVFIWHKRKTQTVSFRKQDTEENV